MVPVVNELRILAVPDIPEVAPGADLGALIGDAIVRADLGMQHGDTLVVAQKLVSKAEGALVALANVVPSALAIEWAAAHAKEPAVVEVVLRQSRRLVRMDRGIIIAETHHGLVCANAGVDASNVPPGYVSTLPRDPDRSAARLRDALMARFGCAVATIISDSFGRPWREGAVNVAIGLAGLRALDDLRGQPDTFGRRLQSTVTAVADELASAAELVMGKSSGLPAAILRGTMDWHGEGKAAALVRPAAMDLFR